MHFFDNRFHFESEACPVEGMHGGKLLTENSKRRFISELGLHVLGEPIPDSTEPAKQVTEKNDARESAVSRSFFRVVVISDGFSQVLWQMPAFP